MSGVHHALTMTSSTGAADPLLASNVLLLKTIGTNNATNASFVDSSSNNFTVTRTGDVTQGAFSPYAPTGYWSAFFDGTGDRITAAHNAAFRLTGDFTVECWVNFVAVAGRLNWLMGCLESSNETGWLFRYTGTALRFYASNLGAIDRSWTPTLGVWYHLAVTRSSDQIRMFIDGVQQGAAVSNSTSFSASTALATVGGDPNFGSDTNAFISNARVVNGTAVYTSNFTPPTTPLTAITNTVLLTCQDNRFIDRSSNNFTLTRAGDVSVRRFAPFGLSWDGSLGGSAYFDGSGDILTAPSNAAFTFGTGDFCMEAWYFSGTTTRMDIVGRYNGDNAGSWGLALNINSTRDVCWYNGNTVRISSSANAWELNVWNHFAVTRSGTTLRLFINGVQVSSATHTVDMTDNGQLLYISAGGGAGGILNGFISSLRIVKGSAVYTSNFTPPTTPVTAISGTSLLLNFDNAAVYDATRASNLSLVGDAKTSTAQVKYATSSVIVDGTGDYVYPATGIEGLAGDFTIEGWIYPTNLTGGRIVYDGRPLGAQGAYPTLYINGTLRYYTNSADRIVGSSVSLNAWTHVAVCRSGSTTRLFQNGTQVGSFSDSVNYLAAAQRPLIGQNGSSDDSHFVGHLEDFRVSRTARYTSAFTPPTRALPVTAG